MSKILLATACCCAVGVGNLLYAEDEERNLRLKNGDTTLLIYNTTYQPSPDPKKPYYGRSGFIHPFYSPKGRVVTDDFPSDHLHQHGLMFAWTTAFIDGRKVDFWNSAKQAGRVEHVKTLHADDNRIVVQLQHVDQTADLPTVLLEEQWEITRVPHESVHIVDLVSTQTCATDNAVKQKQYHYGAMCIRGSKEWMIDGGTFVTSEGKDRVAGNHSRPRWVAMSGKVKGEECGIAAIGHPDNFRAPQPVRLHPKMPYFCFAPMVLGDFAIKPGKPYVSRFRFIAFDGPTDPALLKQLTKEFASR